MVHQVRGVRHLHRLQIDARRLLPFRAPHGHRDGLPPLVHRCHNADCVLHRATAPIIAKLKSAFTVKDMGELQYFLGTDALLQAGRHAREHQTQAVCERWETHPRCKLLQQHDRGAPVPHCDETGHRLCRQATLPPACTHLRTFMPPCSNELSTTSRAIHPTGSPPRHDIAKPNRILGRRLGRLPRHEALDVEVMRVPRRRAHVMVIKAANYGVQVSAKVECRGSPRMLMAPALPRRAALEC